MTILHTSDWHLGHTLYNFDRTEEQRDMLRQITAIVAERQPDALVVSGDVYHTAQPSAPVQTMFAEALIAMHQAAPNMDIVVTAGNHDSASRHEIFRTPWHALGVTAVGTISGDDAERHIVEIPGSGYIVAVPYVNDRNLPEGFYQRLSDAVAERNGSALPVVLMAHTTVSGCDFTGHDNASEYTAGGIDSHEAADLGTGYDYIALGHIHRPQTLHGTAHRLRYSGTPLPVSFDERYEHSVSLVTIASHGAEPQLETIAIANPRPLVTLPAEGYAPWDEARELLRQFPDDIPAYIRLNVETPDFIPAQAQTEAALLCETKACRFCHINAHRPETDEAGSGRALTVEEFRAEQPMDIARRYADDTGITFSGELEETFREVLAALDEAHE